MKEETDIHPNTVLEAWFAKGGRSTPSCANHFLVENEVLSVRYHWDVFALSIDHSIQLNSMLGEKIIVLTTLADGHRWRRSDQVFTAYTDYASWRFTSDAVQLAFRRFVNISPSKRPAQIFKTEAKARAWLKQQPAAV